MKQELEILLDWRLLVLDAAIICELFALYQLVRILIEYYGEKKQSSRKRDKCPSQTNDATGGDLGKLGNFSVQNRRFFDDKTGIANVVSGYFIKTRKNLVNFFSKLFCVWHDSQVGRATHYLNLC